MKVKVITHWKTLKIKITINKKMFYHKSTFGFNTKRRCDTSFHLAVQRNCIPITVNSEVNSAVILTFWGLFLIDKMQQFSKAL